MDAENKQTNWLECALFLLSIGFGIYGIYNIHFDAWKTLMYSSIASLSYALLLACDEKITRVFSKWAIIKVAMFKNLLLFGILILGFLYNSFRNNDKLVTEFILTFFFYFMVMLVTNTWEDEGFFVAIFALFWTVLFFMWILV